MSQVRCLPAPGGKTNPQACRSLLSVVGQAEWSKPSLAAHCPNPPTAEAQFIQPSPNTHSARCTVEGKGSGDVDSIALGQHPRTVATLCSG